MTRTNDSQPQPTVWRSVGAKYHLRERCGVTARSRYSNFRTNAKPSDIPVEHRCKKCW